MEKEIEENKIKSEPEQTIKEPFWQSPKLPLYVAFGVLILVVLGGSYFSLRKARKPVCNSNAECVVQNNWCVHRKHSGDDPQAPPMPWADGEKCECVDGKCTRIDCEDQGMVRIENAEGDGWKCVPGAETVTVSTDKKVYQQGDSVEVIIENGRSVPICFESCNPYWLQKLENARWEDFSFKSCEDNAIENCIDPGDTFAFEEGGLISSYDMAVGTYRYAVKYCPGCKIGGKTSGQETVYSNEFEVRELLGVIVSFKVGKEEGLETLEDSLGYDLIVYAEWEKLPSCAVKIREKDLEKVKNHPLVKSFQIDKPDGLHTDETK